MESYFNNHLERTDPQRRATSSGSFIVENSMTRREYQHKGKEMWQLSTSRKELEIKIKTLQNRINHISLEQQRTEKIIEGTKKKHESFSKIRDEVAQERIQKNELKKQKERELRESKQKLMKETQDLKQKIKEKKAEIVQKNAMVKRTIDENNKIGLMTREKEEHEKQRRLKERAVVVSESIKKIHHTRNSSFNSLKMRKEEEYNHKMQKQLKAQEEAARKIEELEKIEAEFMEKLQSTQRLQETVNSILSSPMHKDLNLLSFNI